MFQSILLLFALYIVCLRVATAELQFLKSQLSSHYTLQWAFPSNDEIIFIMEVNGATWAGLGIHVPVGVDDQPMKNSDIVVGYLMDSTPVVLDMWGSGPGEVTSDTELGGSTFRFHCLI
jgi:hypothetical protein